MRRSMTFGARLLAIGVIGGVLVAGLLYPVVGGVGALAGQAVNGVEATTPGVLGGEMPSVTTITDDAGAPLAYLYDQNRQSVAPDRISTAMKAAIVAIEDRRFFVESGLDARGVIRALVNNSTGGATQGASTLTEQYVKNYDEYVAAHTPAERLRATAPNLGRKVREAEVAEQLDHTVPKDRILGWYLNVVSFGNQTFGVQAAARTYFDTTADRLTIPQAALLAGMVQSPAADDPVRHPAAATGRRNVVIDQMAQQGDITPAQAAEAAAAPLGVDPALHGLTEGCLGAGDAGFFCSYVLDYLARSGIAEDELRRGGYTVRTTMNRAAMDQAKAAVDAEVPPTQPHVADVLSIVAPGAGAHRVTAMVANRGYGLDADQEQTTYDLPGTPENLGAGSVYKIFTSSAYLAQGGGVDRVIPVPANGYASPLTPGFVVSNDGDFPPQMTLQDALAQSPNTAFVKLEETTGVAPVVDMAVKLGLRSLAETPVAGHGSIADEVRAQNQASFTLGPTPTSSLELANVGATLASHGVWCPPSPVTSVTDPSGAPVPLNAPGCEQVVPGPLADTEMTALSKDDQPGGTSAAAAAAAGWNRPTAAKTGTTQTSESGAFVAATPSLSAAAITFDDSSSPRPICTGSPPTSCGTGNLFGGTTPAQTWYRAMTPILGASPVQPLPAPDPRFLTGGHLTDIPAVIGDPVDAATAALRSAGFVVSRASADSRAPAGTVIGESPLGGGVDGQTITVTTSTGRLTPAPSPPGT